MTLAELTRVVEQLGEVVASACENKGSKTEIAVANQKYQLASDAYDQHPDAPKLTQSR